MGISVDIGLTADVSSEHLLIAFEDAEQALADVDLWDGEPLQPPLSRFDGDIGALCHALAEVGEAHPMVAVELNAVAERIREVGIRAARPLLARYPYVLQVLRLSLEIFFRRYPDLTAYERALEAIDEESEGPLPGSPAELWRTRRRLLVSLRRSLS